MMHRAVSAATRAASRSALAAGSRRCLSGTTPFGCWFLTSEINLPHPEKQAKGGLGEDAVASSPFLLTVADGVGGWAAHGEDAGVYSRELVRLCAEEGAAQQPPLDVRAIADKAWRENKATGSSTLCLVAPGEGMTVTGFNLGDSTYMQLRLGAGNVFGKDWAKHHEAKWGVVASAEVQTHFFNCPFQLGVGSGDVPSMADVADALPVKPGDLFLLATDGVIDNLSEARIAAEIGRVNFEPCLQAVTLAREGRLGPGKRQRGGAVAEAAASACKATLDIVASRIAVLSQDVGRDPRAITPFQRSANKHGYDYNGGKLDDVGIALGLVLPAP